MAPATEVRFYVAGLEVLLRSETGDGLSGLLGYYDHYPSRGQRAGVILDIERVPGFATGRDRGPEYPAFNRRSLGNGRIALSRFDAEGEIELPRSDEPLQKAPLRGRFRVGESGNSLEAAVRIAMSMALPRLGALVLHASAVATSDAVLIFAGVSGAGKSTISDLLSKGSDRLSKFSDELLIVRVDESGHCVAHVAPFIGGLGLPHGSALPVAGIHFLAQAEHHRRAAVERPASVRELLKHVLVYVAESQTASRVLETTMRVTALTPCYALEFSKDIGVLGVLGVT